MTSGASGSGNGAVGHSRTRRIPNDTPERARSRSGAQAFTVTQDGLRSSGAAPLRTCDAVPRGDTRNAAGAFGGPDPRRRNDANFMLPGSAVVYRSRRKPIAECGGRAEGRSGTSPSGRPVKRSRVAPP